MKESFKKAWEDYLELDKKQTATINWERFSNRFGKKALLELFENGDKFLKQNDTNFKRAFEYKILSPLKKNKNLDFVKKSTYSSLMSLFSKFRYFLKDYKKNLHSNLLVDNNFDNLKQQEKKDIIKNFVFIPKEEQIMPYEKRYFKINQFGDVVAPGSEYNDNYDIENFIEEEKMKENKTKNSEIVDEKQLKLPFNEIE